MWKEFSEKNPHFGLVVGRANRGNYHRNSLAPPAPFQAAMQYSLAALWDMGAATDESHVGVAARRLARICQWAQEKGGRVRAIGSAWSMSDCFVPGKSLTGDDSALLVTTTRFAMAWQLGEDKHLWYVTCGTQIHRLNQRLEAAGYCLPTSGSSDGQTIAGALGTGVHGAAPQVGALHQAVVAYHVAIPGKHVLVARDGLMRGVLDEVASKFQPDEIVIDEDVFDAISVSFGSFGVVVGVVLRTDPYYALWVVRERMQRDRLPELVSRMKSGNFDLSPFGAAFAGPPKTELHHVQILFSVYNSDVVRLVAMFKDPGRLFDDNGQSIPEGFTWPDGLDSFQEAITRLTWWFRDFVDPIYVDGIKNEFAKLPDVHAWGTRVQVFGEPTTNEFPFHSFALGLPLDAIVGVVDDAFDVAVSRRIPGTCEIRFVKPSPAHLAINRFSPMTAVLGVDGLDGPDSWSFTAELMRRVRYANIPHAIHWGKVSHFHDLGPAAARALLEGMYGGSLRSWLDARNKFLTPSGEAVFNGAFLRRLGLT